MTRPTHLGRTFPLVSTSSLGGSGGTITDDGSGAFPGPGTIPTATGSNTWAWGSNIATITVNQTTKVLGPHVNIANGSNTTVTVDMVGAVASNTIRVHATGGAASFGSNATHVAELSAGGASSDSARMDHYHAGIATITASSSNTMQRGTWNLRPGAGIALALTDTDGDGEFDTTTIVNTGQGGGGSGSSLGGCRVSNSGTLNLNNGSRTTVTFDTEDWDDAGYHSGSGSELTVPATGRYRVLSGGRFSQGGATECDLLLVKNRTGTPVDIGGFTVPGTAVAVWGSVAWEGPLTSGDTVSIQAYIDANSRTLGSHYLVVERLT